MISSLPRWIEYGAFVLAFVAGFVNAIGLLGFEHQAVSHVSGSATLLGTSFFFGSLDTIARLLAILFAFFFGAAISGVMLYGSSLKLERRYDGVLLCESFLLFGAYFLLSSGWFSGLIFASAACGLQNALATTYSGAIIRTTHLTGIFTDLGLMVGAVIRGEKFDKRKCVLFTIIIIGFIGGGFLGAVFFHYLLFKAMLAPAIVCLVLAISYRQYQRKHLLATSMQTKSGD